MTTIQQLSNLARMTVASSGTGTITLANAVQGFLTFTQSLTQAGLVVGNNGYQVSYAINDTTNSEIGTGTYFSSNLTLVRTPHASTNGGAAIDMSNAAQVFITPQLSDLWPVPTTGGGTGTTTQQSSNRVLITTTSGVFTTDANLTYTASAGGGLTVGATAAGSSTTGALQVTGGTRVSGPEWHGGGSFTIDNSSVSIGIPTNSATAMVVQDSSGTNLVLVNTSPSNPTAAVAPVTFGVSPANSNSVNAIRSRQNWYFNAVTHTWMGAANVAGTSSRANAEIVLDQTTHSFPSTAATAITELNGLYVLGGQIVTSTGGFQATVTNNYALRVGNVGSVVGSCAVVTNAYAGYLQKPSGATNNYSLLTDGAIINTETVNASSSGIGSIQTTGGIYAGLGAYVSSNLTVDRSLTVSSAAAVVGRLTTSSAVQICVNVGLGLPTGGSSNAGLYFGSTATFGIYYGSGAPTLTADQGSLYLRGGSPTFTGSSITRLYVASSAAGTWIAVVTVS